MINEASIRAESATLGIWRRSDANAEGGAVERKAPRHPVPHVITDAQAGHKCTFYGDTGDQTLVDQRALHQSNRYKMF